MRAFTHAFDPEVPRMWVLLNDHRVDSPSIVFDRDAHARSLVDYRDFNEFRSGVTTSVVHRFSRDETNLIGRRCLQRLPIALSFHRQACGRAQEYFLTDSIHGGSEITTRRSGAQLHDTITGFVQEVIRLIQ